MSQDITLENHISLIQIELQKNDFKRALDLCLVALDSFPSNPKLLINCGNIFKILGNSSRAVDYYKKSLDYFESKEAYNNLSVIYIESNKNEEAIDMAKIIFGKEFVKENTVIISLINANSPMTWDGTMLGALKEYARSNQAVITTPFILSGAMAPVTPIGVLAQTLAEAMSGMAFAQMINPGAPVVFGSFASSISMQSGAPTFGTPEPAIVLFTAAKLARRLGVPFRSGGSLNGAKIPDAQAAIESLNTLWPSVLGGVNFVLHAAGWLEGGLVSDIRKFIIDADQCSAMSVLTDGPDVTENGQAMDAIRQVGPGQHFLGCDHTQRNFETAFWTSKVSDNSTFEQWSSEGEVDQMQRAGEIAKKLLESYEPPEIDPSIDEALRSFIEKRKEELPNTEA